MINNYLTISQISNYVNSKLSPSAKILFLELQRFDLEMQKQSKEWFYLSTKALINISNLPRSTLFKAKNQLLKRKFIYLNKDKYIKINNNLKWNEYDFN